MHKHCQAERELLLKSFDDERQRWEHERRELLERIQRPQNVPGSAPRPLDESHEPPKDAAELAHLGQVVPDFVVVGDPDRLRAEESEIEKVGTVIPETGEASG